MAVAALEVLLAFRRDQVESNLTLFFEKIARGEDVWSDGHFHEKLAKECELTDFADLVEAVIREQDTAKMDIYANLYTAFVDGEVPQPDLRRHLILVARELTRDEANILLDAYQRLTRKPRNLTAAIDATYEELVKPMTDRASGGLSLIRFERLGVFKEIGGWQEEKGQEPGYTLLPLGRHFVRTAFAIRDDVNPGDWD